MNITIQPDVAAYITERVASGEYATPDDVVNDIVRQAQGLDMCGMDEATLRAEIQKGIDSLEAGNGIRTTPDRVLETILSFRRK